MVKMPEAARKSPVVVSIINLKGGVGKTTVAALLAREVSKELKVLAVDLDPQANLSQALMAEQQYRSFMEPGNSSIVELFHNYLPPSDNWPAPARLDSVVKDIPYNRNLQLIPSRFDFADNLISPMRVDERVLAKFLADDAVQQNDLVLIDCAPTESIVTRAAYHASRYVLVPVRTEFFSTIGFPLLKQSLDDFKSKNRGHSIDVCGVLINNTRTSGSPLGPHHWQSDSDIREKAMEYSWPVMRNEMYHSDGYPKLMVSEWASYTGNAPSEFRPIAQEFRKAIKL